MSKLVLIGGGGHCKSVIDAAQRMNYFDEIVITDPKLEKGSYVLGCLVVGTDDYLDELYHRGYEYAFITIGSVKINLLRERMAETVSAFGYKFPIIRDPSAIVSEHTVIGNGTFIGKNAVINAETRIGKHCIINTGAIIEHESIIGDFTHVSVGTVLCGEVRIGKNCMIGSRSTLIQCVNIGDNCLVGAGAVVINDLPKNSIAVGVPAKIK